MMRLASLLLLLALPCLLTSCGLGGMMKGPFRTLKSAGRTITEASGPQGSPQTSQSPIEIALSK